MNEKVDALAATQASKFEGFLKDLIVQTVVENLDSIMENRATQLLDKEGVASLLGKGTRTVDRYRSDSSGVPFPTPVFSGTPLMWDREDILQWQRLKFGRLRIVQE